MPWKTLCGFPPTRDEISLRIPNGAWRPDTVITDYDGNEMFVLLDQVQEMRTYEAIFGDLDGRRLVCIKRHMIQAFWKDGFYFCTYRPNYLGQKPLEDRDMDNKKLFPFSYLQICTMKGRFYYCCIDNHEELEPPRLMGENPWLGFMVVFCTPMIRCGNWSLNVRRYGAKQMVTRIDQWKNLVTIGSGQDLLAGLCMAYVFDRFQCQPFVTCWGEGLEDRGADDFSISSSSSEDSDESDQDDENSTTMSKASKRRKKARKDAAQSEAEKIDAETYKGPGPPKPGEAYPDQNDPTQHNPMYHRGYRGGTSYQEVNQDDDDFDKDDYYDDDEEKNKDESDESEVILFEQDDAYTAGGGGTTTGNNNNNSNNNTPLYEQGNIPEGDEEEGGGEQEQYHDEHEPGAGGGAAGGGGSNSNDNNDDQSSYLLAPAAQPNPNAKSGADQPFGMALGSVH